MKKYICLIMCCFFVLFFCFYNNTRNDSVIAAVSNVSKITLDRTSLNLKIGSKQKLNVVSGSNNANVYWVSTNRGVATVSNDGVVSAVNIGSAYVYAMLKSNYSVRAICRVTVTGGSSSAKITKLEFVNPTMTVKLGTSGRLKLKVTPSNASTSQIKWSSSNSSVVRVDVAGGVYASRVGTAIVTASSVYNSNIKSSCVITVKESVSNNSLETNSSNSYIMKHKGLKILSRKLSSSEITNINSYVNNQVSIAGYGTGKGVAAAGVALVKSLSSKGVYLGYCWGGDRSSVGAGKSWGKKSGSCNSPRKRHRYFGMDCSGFVSWAIRNGCKSNFGASTANGFKGGYGSKTSIKNAKPGDLMASSSHVRLIVERKSNSIVVAEESGSADGLIFNEYKSAGKYKIVSMSKWYSNHCKKK